MMKVM